MRTLYGDVITTSFPWVSTEGEPYVNKACLLPLSQLQKDPQTGWPLWWLRGNRSFRGQVHGPVCNLADGSCSVPLQAVLLFGRLLPRHDVSGTRSQCLQEGSVPMAPALTLSSLSAPS